MFGLKKHQFANVPAMKITSEEVIYEPTSHEVVDQLFRQKDKKNADTPYLYRSAITVTFIMFSMGCAMTWTSPVLPKLESDDPEINPLGKAITAIEVSLLAGLPSLSALIGTLSLGRVCDQIGRKKTIQYATIVLTLSNTLLAFGRHIYVYYLAKSLFTFAGAVVGVVIPIYLSEISEDHNRGKYGSMMGMFVPMGNLYSYLLGPVTSVRDFTLLCTLPLIVCIILLTLIPESPVHLAMVENRKDSIHVLTKLRINDNPKKIQKDYENIKLTLNEAAESKSNVWSTLFRSKIHRKALIIVLGINMVQQLCGTPVIMMYLASIFNDAGTHLSGNSVAILVGVVKMFSLLLTINIIDIYGKRPLLLTSAFFSTTSIFLLGLYFYWKSINVEFIDTIRISPIVLVLIFITAYALGLGSIPLILVGDMFPGDVKSAASTLTMLVISGTIGIVISIYPIASEQFGIHSCFWFFSMCTLSGSIFIYLKLPETKGKNYLDIEKILKQ